MSHHQVKTCLPSSLMQWITWHYACLQKNLCFCTLCFASFPFEGFSLVIVVLSFLFCTLPVNCLSLLGSSCNLPNSLQGFSEVMDGRVKMARPMVFDKMHHARGHMQHTLKSWAAPWVISIFLAKIQRDLGDNHYITSCQYSYLHSVNIHTLTVNNC